MLGQAFIAGGPQRRFGRFAWVIRQLRQRPCFQAVRQIKQVAWLRFHTASLRNDGWVLRGGPERLKGSYALNTSMT